MSKSGLWKEAGKKQKLMKDNGTRISKEDHEREGRKPISAEGRMGVEKIQTTTEKTCSS